MKKYSKGQLAVAISDELTFENCIDYKFYGREFEFENCTASVVGHATGYEKRNGDWALYTIQLDNIELQFEDSETIFNSDELREMEALIKLWN